jgi:hypothetical protein
MKLSGSNAAAAKLDRWLRENTGLYGDPTPYDNRGTLDEQARNEQIESVCRTKRFVYQLWVEQKDRTTGVRSAMSLGEHEVNSKDELLDLENKLEDQYSGPVSHELKYARW